MAIDLTAPLTCCSTWGFSLPSAPWPTCMNAVLLVKKDEPTPHARSGRHSVRTCQTLLTTTVVIILGQAVIQQVKWARCAGAFATVHALHTSREFCRPADGCQTTHHHLLFGRRLTGRATPVVTVNQRLPTHRLLATSYLDPAADGRGTSGESDTCSGGSVTASSHFTERSPR